LDAQDAQNVYCYSGRGVCTTLRLDVNTFHWPRPSAILNYQDFGAHILKPFMAGSWGPHYLLCEALTSGYNLFLGSRIRIASDLGSYFIIMKPSADGGLDIACILCSSLGCHPDPAWQYQETVRTPCDMGLLNPKVVLKVHVHTENDVEFRVRCALDIWTLRG